MTIFACEPVKVFRFEEVTVMASWIRGLGPQRLRALVVDADHASARLIAAAIAARLPNAEVEIAVSLDAAEKRLEACPFGAVLVNAARRSDAVGAVARLRPRCTGSLFLIDAADADAAAEALRHGADEALVATSAPHRIAEFFESRVTGVLARVKRDVRSFARPKKVQTAL
jgi:hypothetical protein